MAYAAYAKIQNTNDFFKEKVRKYKYIIKQFLNSVLDMRIWEIILRPRFVWFVLSDTITDLY